MLITIAQLVSNKWRRVVYCNKVIHILVDNSLYYGLLVKLGIGWRATGPIPNRFPKYSKGRITLDKGT